jgi:hypothetical protein
MPSAAVLVRSPQELKDALVIHQINPAQLALEIPLEIICIASSGKIWVGTRVGSCITPSEARRCA